VFESGIGASYRRDTFEEPKTDYETVTIPVDMRIGATRTVDLGFELLYLSQSLDNGPSRFTGSRSALVSPEIKISPSRYAGLKFIWHAAIGDESQQELPISRGNDFELKALFTFPARIPLTFNAGYVWKDTYESRQGVNNHQEFSIDPGNIVELTAAVELPLKKHFSIIAESAYYSVQTRKVNGLELTESDGDAADASIGLNWRRKGWDIGAAASFGLLDESHTSFDLERGSGDVTGRFQVHYRLHPVKPESYQ